MMRKVLGVLLAAALLAGCGANQARQAPGQVAAPGAVETIPNTDQSTPGSSPDTTKVTGALPKILHAEQRFAEDFPGGGSSLGASTLVPGDNLSPADDFLVSIKLDRTPDASWYAAIKYEGSTEPPNPENLKVGLIEFRVNEGKPGDAVTVTLPPLAGTEQTVYRFKRMATPTATLEVNQNGTWEPAAPHVVYPNKNLQLRLTFTSAMNRKIVEARMREQNLTKQHPLKQTARLTWQDDRTLLVDFAEAPPVVQYSLVGAYDSQGLFLTGPIPAVHTGAAPYLAAVDPATGKETRLRDVIPEVTFARQSRDGRMLLLTAYDLMGGQESFTRPRLWLMDLANGTTRSIDWDWQARLVETTGEVKVYKYENDGTYDQGPISPDGTQWLFYRLPKTETVSGQLFDVGIEVRTPDGKLIKALEPVAKVMAGKYGYGRPQAVWAPDGKSIIFTSDIDRQQTELIHIDLITGASRKVATVPYFANPYSSARLMQWQAGRVIAGSAIVNVASGQIIHKVAGNMASRFLSQDGKYLLLARESSYNGGDWGPMSLVSIDTGAVNDLGVGMPAGWSADDKALVIRWTNYESRHIPMGL
ncbi:MAG: hypothetical protein K0R39_2608 [Symbiobacteriaceae bacterium]|jgi:hypothetical protein|nr:hypothetical protein [Symbiobacteriaceae bacterium]